MRKSRNPYPRIITDECSGLQISNTAHKIWAEGYKAGRKDEHINKDKRANREVS